MFKREKISFDRVRKKQNDYFCLLISAITSFFICTAWLVLTNSKQLLLSDLLAVSEKSSLLFYDSDIHLLLIILLSAVTFFLISLYFSRYKLAFLALAVLAFSSQEIMMSGFSYFSLFIRYASMIILITLGLFKIITTSPNCYRSVQVVALFYVVWCLFNLLINGFNILALTSLPMQITMMVGILFGLSNLLKEIKNIRYLNLILGWIGVFFTIIHFLTLLFYPNSFINGRFKSMMPEATNFANSYILLFVCMFWLALYKKSTISYFIWTCLGIGLFLIIISGTRTSFIAIWLSTLIFTFFWKNRIMLNTFFIIITIILLLVIIGNIFPKKEFTSRVRDIGTTTRRIEIWNHTWTLIKNRPLIGYGLGNENKVLYPYLKEWERNKFNSHNAYLGTWIQLGILGVVLILFLYLKSLLLGLRFINQKNNYYDEKSIILLPVTILLILFISGFIEQNLLSRGSIHQFFWALCVIILSGIPYYFKESKFFSYM